MTSPRTSPNQTIPSRLARGKYALMSKHSVYSNRGADNIRSYVASVFPELTNRSLNPQARTENLKTLSAITNVAERYLAQHGTVPSPAFLRNPRNPLMEGLL